MYIYRKNIGKQSYNFCLNAVLLYTTNLPTFETVHIKATAVSGSAKFELVSKELLRRANSAVAVNF